MTAPVFVVDSLEGAEPGAILTLDGPEGRHAASVRRLQSGEEVVLTDGRGRGAAGVVLRTEGKDRLIVEPFAFLEDTRLPPRITLVEPTAFVLACVRAVWGPYGPQN